MRHQHDELPMPANANNPRRIIPVRTNEFRILIDNGKNGAAAYQPRKEICARCNVTSSTQASMGPGEIGLGISTVPRITFVPWQSQHDSFIVLRRCVRNQIKFHWSCVIEIAATCELLKLSRVRQRASERQPAVPQNLAVHPLTTSNRHDKTVPRTTKTC